MRWCVMLLHLAVGTSQIQSEGVGYGVPKKLARMFRVKKTLSSSVLYLNVQTYLVINVKAGYEYEWTRYKVSQTCAGCLF